ncbi:hypothetical protein WMY93_029800 [Mugilogobius chulae]|uniref:C2H2-type domain-containing protein n=1 Tax=Mugilogobius chulae TaxID=88201 RepID=A0AAW0MXP4_9GOBI
MASTPLRTPRSCSLPARRNLYATWSRSRGALWSKPWLGRLSPGSSSLRQGKIEDPRFGRLFSPGKDSPKQGGSGVGGRSPPTPSRRIPTPNRIIFRDYDAPPNIVLLGYGKLSYLQDNTKKLARATCVGLRAPWSISPCPICRMQLRSLGKAYSHFHTRRGARIILLCRRCRVSKKSIPSCSGHVSFCGKVKSMSLAGSCLCSACGRTFRTPRGLTQHVRLAHPRLHVERLKQSAEQACTSSSACPVSTLEPLDVMRERLGNPFPPPNPVCEVQSKLLEALGWEEAPTKNELRQATRTLVRAIWRFFGLGKRKSVCSSRAKPLRANYQTCQLLWRKKQKDLVNLILLGGLPQCKIPKEEIEIYYRNIRSTTRTYKGLGQFGDIPTANNVPFQNPITDETAVRSLKNWRPISVGSVIYRTFMGILAERMLEACPPPIPGKGALQRAPGVQKTSLS